MNYKVYVRGHGGEEAQMLPPAEDLNISLITVGRMGCTMEGQVADQIIYHHHDANWIQENISNNNIIYWTHQQRDNWYNNHIFQHSLNPPAVGVTLYENISVNLALDGADDVGECGVCYYSEADGDLHWIVQLADGETILLSEILVILKNMLQEGDSIELYWTACMSAEYWSGNRNAISFNPNP
jgi:hypothetical protein